MDVSGNILKMKSAYFGADRPIEYHLPIGDRTIFMNSLLGKKITLNFDGQINCLETGEKIKKSFGQGYSYQSFMALAKCDLCMVRPELCHYTKGTCREPEWGLKHCYQPHVIYLSNTGNIKVGVTRKTQVPFRWIDQGAIQALPILEVADRHTAGLIEVEIAKNYPDKTDWRAMLKGQVKEIDLLASANHIYNLYGDLFDDYNAKEIESHLYQFQYPVISYPTKVNSLSFDKLNSIESVLTGIKGQYLIFENGVLNIRKFQGYHIHLLT